MESTFISNDIHVDETDIDLFNPELDTIGMKTIGRKEQSETAITSEFHGAHRLI